MLSDEEMQKMELQIKEHDQELKELEQKFTEEFNSLNPVMQINTLIIEKWLAVKKFPQLADILDQKIAIINSKLFLMYKLFIKTIIN